MIVIFNIPSRGSSFHEKTIYILWGKRGVGAFEWFGLQKKKEAPLHPKKKKKKKRRQFNKPLNQIRE